MNDIGALGIQFESRTQRLVDRCSAIYHKPVRLDNTRALWHVPGHVLHRMWFRYLFHVNRNSTVSHRPIHCSLPPCMWEAEKKTLSEISKMLCLSSSNLIHYRALELLYMKALLILVAFLESSWPKTFIFSLLFYTSLRSHRMCWGLAQSSYDITACKTMIRFSQSAAV